MSQVTLEFEIAGKTILEFSHYFYQALNPNILTRSVPQIVTK